MHEGSTSFGACEKRCWCWLFGNEIPFSVPDGSFRVRLELPREYTYTTLPSVSDASIDGPCLHPQHCTLSASHPGGNPGANLKSISHKCHPILVAFVWELAKETIHFPLGCLQGGIGGPRLSRTGKR